MLAFVENQLQLLSAHEKTEEIHQKMESATRQLRGMIDTVDEVLTPVQHEAVTKAAKMLRQLPRQEQGFGI